MTDARQFKKIAHEVAQSAGARVVALHEPGVTPNFFAAELAFSHPKKVIFLLCSRDDDSWAISDFFEPHVCKLHFTDCEIIKDFLERIAGIVLLSSANLSDPFSPRPHMSASDIKYWKPSSLGEGLFNWWD